VPITPAISERAAELIDSLALSHGVRLADALIGATALVNIDTLITANVKVRVHGVPITSTPSLRNARCASHELLLVSC
jgi:predicted nucleic acid-binding protein